MKNKSKLYLGKAGQMYVMSELLMRGWNVAIPEVDLGDDIFVVKDKDGELIRVQVKTGTFTQNLTTQFTLRLDQLQTPVTPLLVYVFVIRANSGWYCLLILSQNELYQAYNDYGLGSIYKNKLTLKVKVKGEGIQSGKFDFTPFINNYYWFTLNNY